MKRRSTKKDRRGPPPGPSTYAKKLAERRLGLRKEKNDPPTLPPLERKAPVAKPGSERVSAAVSGVYLDRGYVFLIDDQNRRIYLSDGTIERYDPKISIAVGDIVECDVVKEDKGLKAVWIRKIRSR